VVTDVEVVGVTVDEEDEEAVVEVDVGIVLEVVAGTIEVDVVCAPAYEAARRAASAAAAVVRMAPVTPDTRAGVNHSPTP
jgi:hypothetical protein